MFHKTYWLSLAFILILFASCDDTTVDPNGMGFTVVLNPNPNGPGPGDLTFDEGYIRVSEIEFEGEQDDDDEIEVEIEQLTTIDLITGEFDPDIGPLSIPAGTYEEFEIEVQGAEDGGTVIFLRGTFTDSMQQVIPLEVDIQESFSLELEWENYVVDSTLAFGATFFIDPQAWFQTISLTDLMQADQTNGIVRISPTENTDLYDRLTAFLDEGIEWEWDDD